MSSPSDQKSWRSPVVTVIDSEEALAKSTLPGSPQLAERVKHWLEKGRRSSNSSSAGGSGSDNASRSQSGPVSASSLPHPFIVDSEVPRAFIDESEVLQELTELRQTTVSKIKARY